MGTPEQKIEDYLVRRVKQIGGWAVKFTSSNNWGLPDRICFFPNGTLALVELKAPGRNPSTRQWRIINRLKAYGFLVTVIDSRPRVDAFIEYMERIIKARDGI